MAKGPGDAPLGAPPMLPPPTGAAAERAEVAFQDYLERLRQEGPALEPPPAPPGHRDPLRAPLVDLPSPDSFAGGRRYDLALSKVGVGTASEAAHPPPASVEVSASEKVEAPAVGRVEVSALENVEASASENVEAPGRGSVAPDAETPAPELPARPPPGKPFIRPPVVRGPGPEAIPQELLEKVVDSTVVSSNPDGTTSFDIAFSDEAFSDVACRVAVVDGRIVATFRVEDDNTRRLLEAEAGRLRVRLEERGLRVQEIRVEVGR